jgi:hypothetical protein
MARGAQLQFWPTRTPRSKSSTWCATSLIPSVPAPLSQERSCDHRADATGQAERKFSMIRTILVPASGSETDAVIFETALAAARPCKAHLEFFHVRVSAGEALRYSEHACFARGKALRNALRELKEESEKRWEAAQCRVRDFCNQHKITIADAPGRLRTISASWREEASNGEEPFITRARVHDLVVMGRPTRPNGLPPNLLPFLLVDCGRPMLIAAALAPRRWHDHGRLEGCAGACARPYCRDAASDRSGKDRSRRDRRSPVGK